MNLNERILKQILQSIGVILIVIFLFKICSSDNDKSLKIPDEIGAYVRAKSVIEQCLKAPSTAKFGSFQETNITGMGYNFEVSGFVDSQNSFGAMLRSNFLVELTGEPGNNYPQWTVDEVVIDDVKVK